MKKTKVIATIGPASEKKATLSSMLSAGMNVCRLNFSFGSHAEHRKKVRKIREISSEAGQSLAVLQDLQGPKIRVGKISRDIELSENEKIYLSGKSLQSEGIIPTTYSKIADDTSEGKTILMADGSVILKVKKVSATEKLLECRVLNGGKISSGKGINLPDTNISLPALTDKDREDAIFGLSAGVDYMGLSFVRTAQDILDLKKLMNDFGRNIPVIAKIEKPEALQNLDEIIDIADGVMVARGDLAVEIPYAEVPLAQKKIIQHANKKGKLTIVATQMMASMISSPLPSRAEAADVANAVLDGSDMLMLSNETATGKYPLRSVKAISEIAEESEKGLLDSHYHVKLSLPDYHSQKYALCESVAHISRNLKSNAIAVITHTGESVQILSKFRPQTKILAGTSSTVLYQRMAAMHNVTPVFIPRKDDQKSSLIYYTEFEEQLLKLQLVGENEKLVFLSGSYSKPNWEMNSINLKTIKNPN